MLAGMQHQAGVQVRPRVPQSVTALEHDMVDRPLAETAARRESGVPGADDDRGEAFDGYATWTLTLVGLVMMS